MKHQVVKLSTQATEASMKQTLEYLKDRYGEEQARFDHLENKCSKFLTFVTVIIAAITALAGMTQWTIFHPKSEIGWAVLIVFLIGSFSIVCSWGHALLALRIGGFSVLPGSRETAEYLLSIDEELASEHIYNCYVDTLEKREEEINQKARNLEFAYDELTLSAWSLGIVATLTIVTEIFK